VRKYFIAISILAGIAKLSFSPLVPGSLALGWSSFQGLGYMSIFGARKFSSRMFAGSTIARVCVFAQAIFSLVQGLYPGIPGRQGQAWMALD
jgi:hypothetical protein